MRTVSTGPEIIIPVDCLLTRLPRRLRDYSSSGMDDAKTNERAEDGMGGSGGYGTGNKNI